uniref:PHD-type domain-containing protein n=1 Tax=Astatotilapia calliptera TaxID=8154 RepID=A0AAX7TSR5_ASTCA
MAAAPLYCVCRQPYDVSRFMIECDICKDWFHGSCVQVEEHHAVDIDVYHCPNCDVVHGPSLMKKRNNWHRHDYTEPDDGSKPVQAGTSVFIKELQNRTFPSAEEILIRMKGELVTTRYLERQGFNYPIAVTEMEGLGLKLPPLLFLSKMWSSMWTQPKMLQCDPPLATLSLSVRGRMQMTAAETSL